MKELSFDVKDHIAEAFRDEVDKVTYEGWIRLTTMPLLYAKSVALGSYPRLFNALRNGDEKSLTDVGLGGCLFWLTDDVLANLRRHENNTISSSVGTAIFNGSSTILTIKRDDSFYFISNSVFYDPTIEGRAEFVKIIKSRPKSYSVVKIVIPYFENDLSDYDAVLDQILSLASESDLRIMALFVNLGTPITVDNQPFN